MPLSVFDLFKLGVGPSSSHTVGPIWAVYRFLDELRRYRLFEQVSSVKADLYGSLALTGKGHATDKATIFGLLGYRPDNIDIVQAEADYAKVLVTGRLPLAGGQEIPMKEGRDLEFHMDEFLPQHPNGMRLTGFDVTGKTLYRQAYFSTGGGFIMGEDDGAGDAPELDNLPYPFDFASELLALCRMNGLTIAELAMENEISIHGSRYRVEEGLRKIWEVMQASIERGCQTEGVLPGGLGMQRRAAVIKSDLMRHPEEGLRDPLTLMDWISLFALAVNEENAAGGRVVTAPTNGSSGVIPAVITYFMRFIHGASEEKVFDFLLTAGAVGMLYKKNASFSAAEMGCQGEIGVACSMAAGGLAAVMGGTPEQIENAAEIGMEHNLGMTCDPVGGLVQIPCIERNTMGAIKAINAARLALRGDGRHRVSLDNVIETMRQTGVDMGSKYKETALGGLAVNVVLC